MMRLSRHHHACHARRALLAALLAAALIAPACAKRAAYPDPEPGRHSDDYHSLFGRLQRIPPKDPDGTALWIIHYGFTDGDKFGGKFNLMPPEKLTGCKGGELVQLTGSINQEITRPDAPGTWFAIDSIRAWSGQVAR